MSVHFQKNSSGVQRAVQHQKRQEEGQEWKSKFQNATDLKKQQRKSKPSTQKTNAAHKTTASSAISLRPDDFNSNPITHNGITPIEGQEFLDYSNAEEFDMKKDLQKFVAPPRMDNDALQKDKLWEMSNKVLDILEQSDATPALKKRAAYLLQEEQQIKSIINGYQNSLIFS